jgi:hypothetical protein
MPLPRRGRHPTRGQSLVEFALLLPILLILIGGIIQYGVIFATKHSLIQVGRDVGRWAATQDFNPCNSATTSSPAQPVTEADLIAQQSHLLGYTAGDWSATPQHFHAYADNTALPPNGPPPLTTESVEVVWSIDVGPCPPDDSTKVSWVTVRLSHRAPVLLPALPFLPTLGTCDSSGCYLVIRTTARFRMEPNAAP